MTLGLQSNRIEKGVVLWTEREMGIVWVVELRGF